MSSIPPSASKNFQLFLTARVKISASLFMPHQTIDGKKNTESIKKEEKLKKKQLGA